MWEFTIIVPRLVSHALPANMHCEFEEDELNLEMTAVCSGDLTKQIVDLPGDKKIFKYQLNVPSLASSIIFSAGPFEVFRIPGWEKEIAQVDDGVVPSDLLSEEKVDSPQSTSTGGYAFCLPSCEDDMIHNLANIYDSMEIMQKYVGVSFPFNSFKFVFVQESYNPLISGAGIAVLGSYLLVPPNVIDQTYETQRILISSIATQWFGHYVSPKNWYLCFASFFD